MCIGMQAGDYTSSMASSASQGIAEQGAETIAKSAVAGAVQLRAHKAARAAQSTMAEVITAQLQEKAAKRARDIEGARSFSLDVEQGPSYAVNHFKG